MPKREPEVIDKDDTQPGNVEESVVVEPAPGELEESLDRLGEAVTNTQQSEQGTANAEAQHTAGLAAMENITEQLELSTGEMVFDIRDFLVDQIKARPKPWSATSQGEQRDIFAAAQHAAEELVRKVVEAVAARGQQPVRVLLTKVTLGDDIVIAGKVKTFDSNEEDAAVSLLHHARGKNVLLTVASKDDYTGNGREADVDDDEPPLNFEAGTEAADAEDDES